MEHQAMLHFLAELKLYVDAGTKLRNSLIDYLVQKPPVEAFRVETKNNQIALYGVVLKIVIEIKLLPDESNLEAKIMACRLRQNGHGENLLPEPIGATAVGFDKLGNLKGMQPEMFPALFTRQMLQYLIKETFTL